MRAFYHPDQALHHPLQYMRFGKIVDVKDLPIRTEKLLGALKARGITPEVPTDFGLDPAGAVHTPAYLTFLETAWTRWLGLADHGPEVWPNTFPYWSGAPDRPARPPCRAETIAAQAGWYLGDLSVPMGPHSWTSILRACDTAVAAADAVTGDAGPAYALCRPSGHHARADRASGFCYLNNTAVAAKRLRRRFGKVAVIDVDAHHGDGTQQIFYGRSDVLTISIHADPVNYYPFYTGYPEETGCGAGEGYNLNVPLRHGADGAALRAALATACRCVQAFAPDVLVIALGYDAHCRDPIGVLALDTADFWGIGRDLAALALPTLVVQEGGYAIDVIGDCLAAFLDGFEAEA